MVRRLWVLWLFLVAVAAGTGLGLRLYKKLPTDAGKEAPSIFRVAPSLNGAQFTQLVTRAIDGAKTEVLIACRDIDAPEIADALARAASRNIDVRVLIDVRKRTNLHQGLTGKLRAIGLSSTIGFAPLSGNWVILDARVGFSAGSLSSKGDYDHIVALSDKAVAAEYRQAFLSIEANAISAP